MANLLVEFNNIVDANSFDRSNGNRYRFSERLSAANKTYVFVRRTRTLEEVKP